MEKLKNYRNNTHQYHLFNVKRWKKTSLLASCCCCFSMKVASTRNMKNIHLNSIELRFRKIFAHFNVLIKNMMHRNFSLPGTANSFFFSFRFACFSRISTLSIVSIFVLRLPQAINTALFSLFLHFQWKIPRNLLKKLKYICSDCAHQNWCLCVKSSFT